MALEGKTYSLFNEDETSACYHTTIRRLADDFLRDCPDEKKLLALIRKAGEGILPRYLTISSQDRQPLSDIRNTLRDSLSIYTKNVAQHLKTLSTTKRLDATLATREEQYHLHMIEIELVNRIYREEFKKSACKFALIAHCVRDFRPECRAETGAMEAVCQGCTDDCLVHLASTLLRKHQIESYISVRLDQDKLFKQLKREHPSIGALGIACVPELAMGMRLCIGLGIAPIGIPLDANRCARWMGEAQETSFNLRRLEDLLGSP